MNINTKKYIEEFLKIKNKKSEIIPFKLNYPQQKLYDVIKQEKRLHKPVRIIILKARQMGFSTLTEAILFKETATKFNVSTGIITHQEDATTNLFNMSKLFYTELPAEIRPQLLNSNAKELIFNNREGTGLNSKIRCMTAGSKGVGRSATYNKLHISELAFWQGDKKEILTGLLQTVPYTEDSMVIIESTANGFDYYKTMWDEAVRGDNDYIPVFIGWNDLPEYQLPYNGFTLTQEEKNNAFLNRSDEILESSVTARLLSFPNVIITSHQGFFTNEALAAISKTTLDNATAFMKGEKSGTEVE